MNQPDDKIVHVLCDDTDDIGKEPYPLKTEKDKALYSELLREMKNTNKK